MAACTFFGHRDTPDEIQPLLREVLIDLIEKSNVKRFYVGNHGNFDAITCKTLCDLQRIYPDITLLIVRAYLPTKETIQAGVETIYPEGLEKTPPKFAILKRNERMLSQSDFAVFYIKYTTGGAAKFYEKSIRSQKHIINLADICTKKDHLV